MSISKSNWFKYLSIGKMKWLIVPIIIALLLSAIFGFFVPKIIQDVFSTYDNDTLFYSNLYLLLYLFIGIYINRATYEVMIAKFIQNCIEAIRTHCYEKWLLNYEAFEEGSKKPKHKDQYPLGEVLARIMNDTEAIRELVSSGAFGIFIDLFFIISCLISLISIHAKAGTILVGAEVLACCLLLFGSRYMAKVFLKVRKSNGIMSRTVADVAGGLNQTYYTRHHDYASKKSRIVFQDFLTKQLKANIWDAGYYSVAESLYPLFLLILVVTVPYTGIRNAAIIAVFIDLIQRSINPLKAITGKIANIQRAATGIERLDEFLRHLGQGQISHVEKMRENIDFNQLEVRIDDFSYETDKKNHEAFRLREIELTGQRGDLIGIVGLSGSGKSTLLNIICGHIIPKNALIKLSELDVEDSYIEFPSEHGHSDYIEQVGIVSQDSHVFTESMQFNISLSRESGRYFDQFWQYMVEQVPYLKTWGISADKVINPSELSLGQKQLISALRACYLRKPVVLFDEVSSSMDAELEESLRKTILLIQKNSLTIIVAHRIETVVQADKIIVMDKGSVVAMGKHDELLNSSQVYREFVDEITNLT